MKLVKYILSTAALATIVASCSYFEPDLGNTYDQDRVLSDPSFAEGLLLQAYTYLPTEYDFEEVATDDAVSNDKDNDYLSLATGSWTSNTETMEEWDDAYEAIGYLNNFLSVVDKIEWSWQSEYRDSLFRTRYKGEALALRAYFHFQILMAHGGEDASGTVLGIPYVKSVIDATNEEEWLLARPSYASTVEDLFADLDSAVVLLPYIYEDIKNEDDYNRVNGEDHENRVSGLIASAIKARVALHAASPAFNSGEYNTEWATIAAKEAATLIGDMGGVSALSGDLKNPYFYKTNTGRTSDEVIWRSDYESGTYDWESDIYPPSLYGDGRVNPSQNFVDAFPMANGYPVNDLTNSGYSANDPYASRDPRLTEYVLFNGGAMGSDTIYTYVSDSNIDGLGVQTNSTRTGYYLKKIVRPDVTLTPSSPSGQIHIRPLIRYTEMYLIYAEAAYELWGADADPNGYGFTPRQIINGIRTRAGITSETYINSLSQSAMSEVIRNERRIELSFEGFRFWDLRRWELDLTEAVDGMKITESNGTYSYATLSNVETRAYKEYMQYGPIPNDQILRCNVLVQNYGW